MLELAVLVGALQPRLGPGVHPLHPVACMLQGRSCLQGQGSLEVMSLSSELIRGQDFKVMTPSVVCKAVLMLGGEDAGAGCAVWGLTALPRDLVSTLSTQWPACCKGGQVFKVKVVWRSCL